MELLEANHRGWIFYLDADAYIADMEFDIHVYLKQHHDRAMIIGPGGLSGEPWDLNDGVFLINLAHETAREIVRLWHASLFETSDGELRDAPDWENAPNDQSWLQCILRRRPDLGDAIEIADRAFFNDYQARFVRQIFRSEELTLQKRKEIISAERARMIGESSCKLVEIVSGLYHEILGRAPDEDGLRYYLELAASIAPIEQGILHVVRGLTASEEFSRILRTRVANASCSLNSPVEMPQPLPP
jgi:hypothetical protein